jgi:hypothetical protein
MLLLQIYLCQPTNQFYIQFFFLLSYHLNFYRTVLFSSALPNFCVKKYKFIVAHFFNILFFFTSKVLRITEKNNQTPKK